MSDIEAQRIFMALEKGGHLRKLDAYAKKFAQRIAPMIEENPEIPFMVAKRFLFALLQSLPPTRETLD